MSFTECSVSELDLFSGENIQTSILSRKEVVHYPLNSLENASSLEFHSSGQVSTYRDLSNVFLKLNVQILKPSKSKFSSTTLMSPDKVEDQPGLVTNTLHSLFRSIQVVINNRTVSNHDFYHYKAYFELLTNYRPEVIANNFSASGAILDTDANHESLTANSGLTARKKFTDDSKEWELYGRLSLDLSNQPKLIINNLDIRFVFQMEQDAFILIGSEGKPGKVVIKDASLYMTHCEINPNMMLYHTQLLGKTNIKYPFTRTVVKTITLSSGIQSQMIDHIFTGILPTYLLMTFVENASFTGNIKKNPFFLKHYKVKSIQLYKNNDPVPQEPLEYIDTDYARAYSYFLDNIDVYNTNKNIVINQKNYTEGFFLAAFNLSPLSQITNCNNIHMDGTLRVQLHFKEALSHAVTAIFYACVPDVLEVDSNYNVSTKFN